MNITHEITEHIVALSKQHSGWRKELNLVSWSGNEPKYDIRGWNNDHTKCTKGVTLTVEELSKLKNVLENLDI